MRIMHKKRGFTLMEMTVVVAIIGLIVGGVVLSQSMVKAAEIRSVIGEYDSTLKGIREFQDKYMAVPGDMTGATTLWGVDPAGCPNATYSAVPQTATCDGDGNGRIGASTALSVLSGQTEWWRAWQHLSNAGFIQGSFTGVQGAAGVGEVEKASIGVNVPRSKFEGAGWTLLYYLNTSGNAGLWSDTYGHIIAFGAASSASYTKGAALTPADASTIDSKIDDGKPGMGNIRTWRTDVQANCTAADTTQSAQAYNTLGYSVPACALVFLLGF